MDIKHLFDWVRINQSDSVLFQSQVEAINTMLENMDVDSIIDSLSKLNGWRVPNESSNKKLTKVDIVNAAKGINVEPAALKAVIDIEARGSGFDSQGRPTILFERHKFWDELGKVNYFTVRKNLNSQYPDVCSPSSGSYNTRPQYDKLAIAANANWDAAHKSASWGLGQLMGFHFSNLGYASIKEFVDAMYESEAKQLDGMIRYLKVNNLIPKLNNRDWAGFARGYNGSAYAINKYDIKLANAYAQAKKDGW